MKSKVLSPIDNDRFECMKPERPRREVKKLNGFKVGDLVSCYRCEKGRIYMPGIGVIEHIYPDEEYPFVRKHRNKQYTYKAAEIEEHDLY